MNETSGPVAPQPSPPIFSSEPVELGKIAIDPVAQWMSKVDERIDAGETNITFTRPGAEQPETLELVDAVKVRAPAYDDHGNRPEITIAALRHSDGTIEEVPVADLLAWQAPKSDDEAVEATQVPGARKGLVGTLGNVGLRHAVTADATPDQSVEQEPASRLRQIFAPVLDDNHVSTEKVPETGRKVDDWTYKHAAGTVQSVMGRDVLVRDLIAEHATKQGVDMADPIAIVDFVRTNPDIRLALGKTFMLRLDRLANIGVVGDRIIRNDSKSPPIPGYTMPTMKSREYSALLALSHLDGTYDNRREKEAEGIEYGSDGRAFKGQHRDAAEKLLWG